MDNFLLGFEIFKSNITQIEMTIKDSVALSKITKNSRIRYKCLKIPEHKF